MCFKFCLEAFFHQIIRIQDIFAIQIYSLINIFYKNQVGDLELWQDFAEQLQGDDKLKHPFRHFKFIIDNSGQYRQQWFEFKRQN